MSKKIIFSAGGTGGHIFPAINLMKHFSEKGYDVILVTDKRGNAFISGYSEFRSYILTSGTPTNKNFINKFLSFFIIFYSLLKATIILKKEKADLAIGFGGYVSFPISFVSRFFNLPLLIYENNSVLGRANRFLLPLAKKILLSNVIKKNFPEKYKNKIHKVGPILNKNIFNNLKTKKNYDKDNFSLLILGGSQGAEIFGKIIPSVVKMIKNQGYNIEVIQQCIQSQKDSGRYLKNE